MNAAPKDAGSKPRKPSFFASIANRGRETLRLGRLLFDEPRKFPGELLRLFKRSFRTLWDARGGGLYAFGFVVTFFYLETNMFVGDVIGADSVGGFFAGQLTDMLFHYLGQSMINTVKAFIWPAFLVEFRPPVGIALLVAMYVVFPRYVKAHVESWLFDETEEGPRNGPAGTD